MRFRFGISALSALACALVMGVSSAPAGEAIQIGGTGASLEYTRVMAEAYMARDPDARVVVHEGLGSSGGIRAVIAGALDIAISGRPLKEKEIGKGVVAEELMITPLWLFHIAAQAGRCGCH